MAEDRDPVEEIMAHRDDPDEWDEQPEAIEVRPRRTDVVSFRLPTDEMEALEANASAAGETISEYLRKAVALRIYGEPIGPAVEITTGAKRLVIRSHIVTSSTRDAPGSFVQDVPPITQAI